MPKPHWLRGVVHGCECGGRTRTAGRGAAKRRRRKKLCSSTLTLFFPFFAPSLPLLPKHLHNVRPARPRPPPGRPPGRRPSQRRPPLHVGRGACVADRQQDAARVRDRGGQRDVRVGVHRRVRGGVGHGEWRVCGEWEADGRRARRGGSREAPREGRDFSRGSAPAGTPRTTLARPDPPASRPRDRTRTRGAALLEEVAGRARARGGGGTSPRPYALLVARH